MYIYLRFVYGLIIGNIGVHSWDPNGSVTTLKKFPCYICKIWLCNRERSKVFNAVFLLCALRSLIIVDDAYQAY